MVDMDDVLTSGTFQKQIEDYIGEKINFQETGYYLQNALKERKEEFFQKGPLNMYQDAPLLPDVYEVLKKCNEKYELYIVSAYDIIDAPYQIGNHLKFKIEYLLKKLPFIQVSQIIFCNKKNLIDFDIIIDDSPKNLKSGKMKLLFSSYHNLELSEDELKKDGIRRVNNWSEIAQLLLEEE